MHHPILTQCTQDEYLRREESRTEKSELHHGFAVAFAGGTILHDQLASRVRTILASLFPEPCLVFGSDVKVKVSADMFLYPDVGVICEPVDFASVYVELPRIVVEVLSPSTRGYDVIEKRAAYRSLPSLEAYLIVHYDIRRIEVDVRGFGGTWRTMLYHEHDDVLLGDRGTPVAAFYGPFVAP